MLPGRFDNTFEVSDSFKINIFMLLLNETGMIKERGTVFYREKKC